MKFYIHREILELFQIEIKKFGSQKICLTPVWVKGKEPKVWAIIEAPTFAEPIVELKSKELSVWVLQRYLAELDDRVLVRGRRGFVSEVMTDSLISQVTLFAE